MSKRKANIFTVAELVTNWFEASGYNVASLEEIDGVVTNRLGPISEGSVLLNVAHYESIEPTAGWARSSPRTWLTATGSADLADRLGEGQRDQGPTETIKPTETGPVDRGPTGAANKIPGVQSSREPTGLADMGEPYTAGPTGEHSADDVARRGGLSQHPLWALLMVAG